MVGNTINELFKSRSNDPADRSQMNIVHILYLLKNRVDMRYKTIKCTQYTENVLKGGALPSR